jgi:hypothetical protein
MGESGNINFSSETSKPEDSVKKWFKY